jgi:hypothetical protein
MSLDYTSTVTRRASSLCIPENVLSPEEDLLLAGIKTKVAEIWNGVSSSFKSAVNSVIVISRPIISERTTKKARTRAMKRMKARTMTTK